MEIVPTFVDTPPPVQNTPVDKFQVLRKIFLDENTPVAEHLKQQKENFPEYVSVLLLLLNQGAELSKASRTRILAACWSRSDHVLADYLLAKSEIFSIPQVLGALNILDSQRKIREIEKKIERLKKLPNVKASTMGQLKNQITNLSQETLEGASASGALGRHLKRWAKTVPKENLEFYALQMPKETWKQLADITHLHSNDLQVPWFLDFCFGKPAPEDSIVGYCEKGITAENVVGLLKGGLKIPYSYLRTKLKPIPEEVKLLVAVYTPLSTLIWWFDEICCQSVEELILKRLEQGEEPGLPFGKLMERLLYFKDLCFGKGSKPNGTVEEQQKSIETRTGIYRGLLAPAEVRLKAMKKQSLDEISSKKAKLNPNSNNNAEQTQYVGKKQKEQPGQLSIEGPIAVIGDASGSMEVAIRVSTVISALFSAICNAELTFFNGKSITPPFVPQNAEQVVELTQKMKAEGMTAPAAGLWSFFVQKKIVKTIIVVSDEAETTPFMGFSFAKLYKKYYEEIFPAKIVIFSFVKNNETGIMTAALERMDFKPSVFKFDGARPDLTKLDGILGILATEAKYFSRHAAEICKILSVQPDSKKPEFKEAFQKATHISHDPATTLQIPEEGEEEAELEKLKQELATKQQNSNSNGPALKDIVFKPVNTEEVDLVFVIDTTGSMGSYIKSAKDKILEIMHSVGSILKVVRFAVVAWRDHPPEDPSYITKVYPFTSSPTVAKKYVDELSASGGGDTPEAVADAVYELSKLPWKEDILKIAVFVADAPPHGLPQNSDNKPKGWDTHDPIAIAHELSKQQVTIYSVGCEPVLSSSMWGSEFFKALAEIGGGRYISLSNASILPDIIIGGVTEELELEKISEKIVSVTKELAGKLFHGSIPINETDQIVLFSEVCRKLSDQGISVSKLELDTICEGLDDNVLAIAACKTFAEATQYMSKSKKTHSKASATSTAQTKKVEVELDQVRRVLKKKGLIQ